MQSNFKVCAKFFKETDTGANFLFGQKSETNLIVINYS